MGMWPHISLRDHVINSKIKERRRVENITLMWSDHVKKRNQDYTRRQTREMERPGPWHKKKRKTIAEAWKF